MKWYDNTDYICQKGYSRIWMLRRLVGLGASIAELADVYEKQVRTVLELAVDNITLKFYTCPKFREEPSHSWSGEEIFWMSKKTLCIQMTRSF